MPQNHRNKKNRTKASQWPEDILDQLARSSPLLKHIAENVDTKLIRQNGKLTKKLSKVLAAASPKSTRYLISGIAVDLADFWEIAIEHERRVKELSRMRFPRDRKRFVEMLYEFEIRLVMHADWHARYLKRRLTKLKRDLKLTSKAPPRPSE